MSCIGALNMSPQKWSRKNAGVWSHDLLSSPAHRTLMLATNGVVDLISDSD